MEASVLDNGFGNKVSIIMPAHNSSKYIGVSIKSVLNQTYSNWELIVVNDRSTDNTKEIILGFAEFDSRIIFTENRLSYGGAYFARNIGLNIAQGRYIAFLDSDDIWMPEKLTTQISTMVTTGFAACHCSYIRIDKNGSSLKNVNVLERVSFRQQLMSNRIPNLTGVYDRSEIGLILQDNVGHEDYDMWLKVLSKTDSIGVIKPLAKYRVLSNSLSSNKFKAMFWHFQILMKQPSVGFLMGTYYFLGYIFNAVLKRVL